MLEDDFEPGTLLPCEENRPYLCRPLSCNTPERWSRAGLHSTYRLCILRTIFCRDVSVEITHSFRGEFTEYSIHIFCLHDQADASG